MSFFTKNAVGLDIADHTIEAIELTKSFFSQSATIVAQNRVALEYGIVDHGKLTNRKKLTESLQVLWEGMGRIPRSVIFGLPENQVYSSVIHIPGTQPLQEELIYQAAVKTLPIEKDDLAFSYSLISTTSSGMDVLLYGASKEVMNDWRDFFASIQIDVHAFDHELLAIERGLFGGVTPNTCCIVDVGAERTKIAIFSKRGLEYVHAIDTAGDVFTLEMSKALELPRDEAEKLKREQGMEPVNLTTLFTNLLSPIISEIHTAVSYAKDNVNNPVVSIVLVGGSSRLKGLTGYIQEQLGMPVVLGNSFLSSKSASMNSENLHYIEAIGLAMKGIDPIWEKRQPSLK